MNKNKNKDKVSSVDSNTLDYYNDNMSKKAVGKLMQHANKDEGVRPITRDEYKTFSNQQKKLNNHSDNQIHSISNSTSGNNNQYTQNLNTFIRKNQTVTEKPKNTLHKNELKEKINKLKSNENIKINNKPKSVIDTYVHQNLNGQIDDIINENTIDSNTDNFNNKPNIFIDDFTPQKSNVKKIDKQRKKPKKQPSFTDVKVSDDKFNDDNYFSTLRTSRLSTSNVELDYENLPYSTMSHKNLNKKINERSKNKDKYIEDNVLKEVDKHIRQYNETTSMNEDLVNIVRQTTQEVEKQQSMPKSMQNNSSPSQQKHSRPQSTRSQSNTRTRKQNGHQPNNNYKQKPKGNPTVAFIRISSFIVIIALSISLISNIIKISNLQATIKEQEEQIKDAESLTTQINELRLANDRLQEQLNSNSSTENNSSSDNVNTSENTENSENNEDNEVTTLPTEYTVQTGDNLSKISNTFYGNKNDYNKIVEANNLTDTNVFVGQVLTIPQ